MKSTHFLRFHMKIDDELATLLSLSADGNKKRISYFINTVFHEVFHLIEKCDITNSEANLQAEPEQSKDCYLLIEKRFKNKLFQIQEHFKLRSKAAVVRLLLRIYIVRRKKYSDEQWKRIMGFTCKQWENKKQSKKVWKKKRITHMSNPLPVDFAFLYSKDIELTEIQFLC